MPRRRMIDPLFWDDRKVGKLSRDERSLIVGCVGHADDDGRLQADPAYLKATVFKYDDDLDQAGVQTLRDNCLTKMQSWPATHPYRMVLYHNSDEEYMFFPNWGATNRPSHPTKSQLPSPPLEPLPPVSSESPETLPTSSETSPSQSRSGQSSQGQVRLGQVRVVQEDFTKFSNESDLTESLTRTLTTEISAGRQRAAEGGLGGGGPGGDLAPQEDARVRSQWGVGVLEQFWAQRVGKMSTELFEGSLHALNKYPLEVIAKAFTKAARYKGGKHHRWNYIQTILDEETEKGPHGERGP